MVKIITSKNNWLEGEAIQQLENAAKLPGMTQVIGMPDLHPGKGYPVGAVFACREFIYPYLIGNDIGCGMGLWQTNLKAKKSKLARLEKRLAGLDHGDAVCRDFLAEHRLPVSPFNKALGTIGSGNHFAEIQIVEKIFDQSRFTGLGLSKISPTLLVHSGSRGLGQSILQEHIEKYKAAGLQNDSEAARHYLQRHDHAVAWAKVNRSVIARSILDAIGCDGQSVLDLPHNLIMPETFQQQEVWLHRKGAVPSNSGSLVIAGSRGSFTYLVQPLSVDDNLLSLAHGAGRKWRRGECRSRLSARFKKDDLFHTDLGGTVICEDKALLYEEAPQAYKNIDVVVQCLLDIGAISLIAKYRPLLTYKKRGR